MTLKQLKKDWVDTPEYHSSVTSGMVELVNKNDKLKAHRDYVQEKVWGFGERAFWGAWSLILDTVPSKCTLLEIGVFRGATLSVWKLLKPYAKIYGITPLDTTGGYWESDYAKDIAKIHNDFNQPLPPIYYGRSDNERLIKDATERDYDVVYVDGDHSYEGCMHDLKTYSPFVKKGGYLVIDDSCSDMKMEWGVFQGHQDVTRATLDFMKNTTEWEFITNVVHLRIYQRIK